MKVFVCSVCGAKDSISKLVELEGWEGITVEDDGTGKPKAVESGEREAEWIYASVTGYNCCECDTGFATVEEAVAVKGAAECRECGFNGGPDEHPADCLGELLGVEPPAVHPEQAMLEVVG